MSVNQVSSRSPEALAMMLAQMGDKAFDNAQSELNNLDAKGTDATEVDKMQAKNAMDNYTNMVAMSTSIMDKMSKVQENASSSVGK
ncbi:hypothetical protein [Burkholderia ubonensis]|uniref:hypothetical protein n=1 Tax=Burkholderia ubonensis TaxID=101571 RepID=UPI000A8D2211|nr:hypothetical protein [Burkholderia ubonensis]